MLHILLAAAVIAAPASPTRIEADTRFLADDALEGRKLGARGHEIAAAYVASRFAALGLTPGGTDGWMQRVTFQRRSFTGARETLAFGGKTYVNGSDLRVGPAATAGADSVVGGLVFAGFGLDAPTMGIDDYAGLDVRGKIVVVLTGAPLGLDSEVGASLGRSKGEFAARRGAAGMIIVRTLAEIARRPWPKIGLTAREPTYAWVGPDGRTDTATSALRFSATAGEALGAALFGGATQSLAALQAAVAADPLLRPKGFALAGEVRVDRQTAVDRISSPNVVGVLPGTTLRDEYVLLTAHADHLGIAANGDVYNGAQDNAAGVAMLLEAARQFTAKGEATRRSLMFIVTTGEESGLLGADYFAHFPTVPIERVVSVVDIDMPILTCDFGEVVAHGASHSTLGKTLAQVARPIGIGMAVDPTPAEAVFTRSDHYQLVRVGVPALFIKSGPGDRSGGKACGVADRAFRSTQYHEPSDDMALPFDWRAAARFTDLNIALTRAVADGRDRPRWYEGDFFGETFAVGAPKAAR